ncbi:MAG: hypothetical protein LH609_18425, partial [Rudanella sp.]|nr:hypothetical protein [Rudanella sp.]
EPIGNKPVGLVSPQPGGASINRFWFPEAFILVVLSLALGVLIYREKKLDSIPPSPPVLPCSFGVGVKSVQGNTVTFANRNPCPDVSQNYVWNFGDGTPPLSTSLTTVRHEFRNETGKTELGRVTLRGDCCPEKADTAPTSSTYNPSPLPFLRLPETSRYTLANWVPLLLMGLGGLLGGGWWWFRRRRQRAQTAQRPTDGPFFLSFPQQDDAIQPSPSLVSWAHQLQQREESERHVLAIGPTIRRTIRNGGMPSVQFEAIKRRPRYLILIDDRSAYDQQAKLYGYIMGVLITRSVEMDVFFFHSDPRYLWNENYPKGLPISDLFRLYSSHYLVLVTEGTRLLDYDTGEVATWAAEALSGWTSRALLTPVYPANWHYLEAALSRFFILLPATPDGQFLLRDYLGQPDNAPSFEELLRQFKVMPGSPNRGIFSLNSAKLTVDDVRTFLNQPIPGTDQTESVRKWLFAWACATAVFPTPDWAMTLAIGRALETHFNVEGLVTSTNILKLTALPWLRQDSIPEPLRANLLAQLLPEAETVARKTVVDMLNDLRLSPGSVAYEEQQLRFWEQEYHLNNHTLGQLASYRPYPDLVKDEGIRQRLARQDKLENKYQPAGLLVLLLLPLLLYFTPPRTQVAGFLMPFFQLDATAIDSAAFYNNRAVASFQEATASKLEPYGAIEKQATSTAGKSGGSGSETTPPIRPKTITKQKIKPRPVPQTKVPTKTRVSRLPGMSVPADTVSIRKTPVSKSPTTSQEPVANNPSPGQTSPANQPVLQTDLPATAGADNNPAQPVQQQTQLVQQQAQQTLPDENDLQQVYEQGTKCPPNSSFFIALPNGDKRPIKAGDTTPLSDSPNLYEVIFYCDSYPQTIYSKRGFSHVKVMNDPKGGLRVVLYQNRPKGFRK